MAFGRRLLVLGMWAIAAGCAGPQPAPLEPPCKDALAAALQEHAATLQRGLRLASRARLEALAARLSTVSARCPKLAAAPAAVMARADLRDRIARISRSTEDLARAKLTWTQAVRAARTPDRAAFALARGADLALSFDDRAEGFSLLRSLAKRYPDTPPGRQARLALAILRPLAPTPTAARPHRQAARPRPRAPLADYRGRVIDPAQVGIRFGSHTTRPRRLTRFRHWSTPGFSRVVVWFDHPVRYAHGLLPPEPGRPARLYLDFPGARLARRVRGASPTPGHLVSGVRLANRPPTGVRLVLDLAKPCRFFVYPLEHPYRVVIDLAQGHDAGAAGPLPPVRVVALDAGHGGAQKGATGPTGLMEKDVTLNVARAAAGPLRKAGIRVILTRNSDQTLSLEERTAVAISAGADLFVSIHANAEPTGKQAGIETYVLNVESDRYAARIAARENQTAGHPVSRYRLSMVDMTTRALTAESRRLAKPVQAELLRAARRFRPGLRDRSIRQALFYVLLTARMPGILTEVSFLSNPAGERALRRPDYRRALGLALARGILRYARDRATDHRLPTGGSPLRVRHPPRSSPPGLRRPRAPSPAPRDHARPRYEIRLSPPRPRKR